jgi:hypothetical protein
VWDALQGLEEALDVEAMRELNYRVAVEGEDAAAVVRAWREARRPLTTRGVLTKQPVVSAYDASHEER